MELEDKEILKKLNTLKELKAEIIHLAPTLPTNAYKKQEWDLEEAQVEEMLQQWELKEQKDNQEL